MEKRQQGALLLLLVSASALIGLAAWLPDQGGYAIDRYAETLAAAVRSDGLTALSRLLAYLGSTIGVIAITLICALGLGWKAGWRSGALLIGGVGAAYGMNLLLKALFNRARPELAWGIEVSGASFPSGHATLGCAMFGLIALLLLRIPGIGKLWRAVIVCGAAAIILLMAASRVYFHVHYLSDVLAGLASGLLVISVVLLVAGNPQRARSGHLRQVGNGVKTDA